MWASPSDQLSVYPQQRWSHRSQQLICPPNNSSPHPIPEGPMWYTHHFLLFLPIPFSSGNGPMLSRNKFSTRMKCQALKLSFLMLSLILLLSSSTLGSPYHRGIYIASFEAHVEHLYAQLLSMGLYPIPLEKLQCHHRLNLTTTKVRVPTFSM